MFRTFRWFREDVRKAAYCRKLKKAEAKRNKYWEKVNKQNRIINNILWNEPIWNPTKEQG